LHPRNFYEEKQRGQEVVTLLKSITKELFNSLQELVSPLS